MARAASWPGRTARAVRPPFVGRVMCQYEEDACYEQAAKSRLNVTTICGVPYLDKVLDISWPPRILLTSREHECLTISELCQSMEAFRV